MITREEAIKLVEENVSKATWRNHMLAVEAIMRALARELGKDEELWGLVGLLHDLDYDKTANSPERHGFVTAEMLRGKLSEEGIRAILAHNFEHTGIEPQTEMEKALVASDAVSGLLVATALVMPSKKLEEVKVSSLRKKFKQKDFARGVSRERILFCEQIGIPLERFFEISLEALKPIASQLGL